MNNCYWIYIIISIIISLITSIAFSLYIMKHIEKYLDMLIDHEHNITIHMMQNFCEIQKTLKRNNIK
jgi:hypothetical protein